MAEIKQRYSKQRETIYEVLAQDITHPTVDTIYMNVKKIIPDISLGTVYRNLNLLADQKRILRLDVGDGVVHYDARITPHFHLFCKECGGVSDVFVDGDLITPLIDNVQGKTDDQIDSVEVLFRGTCSHCLKKKS